MHFGIIGVIQYSVTQRYSYMKWQDVLSMTLPIVMHDSCIITRERMTGGLLK
jgi:hypothetical protein